MEWLEAVNKQVGVVKSNLSEEESYIKVKILDYDVVFPRISSGWEVNPVDWIKDKHVDGNVHEPGLLAWLLTLSKNFSSKKVQFYDVGALFSYVGAFAYRMFDDCSVHALEGNPLSTKYILQLVAANSFSDMDAKNVLVSDHRDSSTFIVKGFEFFLVEGFYEKILVKLKKFYLPNFVKKVLNVIANTNYQLFVPHTYSLQELPLEEILKERPSGVDDVLILKFDTEGYQAKFLPPCSEFLIKQNAIILIEFDEYEKVQRFGQSNESLCAPFLAAGYTLFWGDHRDKKCIFKKLNSVCDEHEVNSLGVLIPEVYI